VEKLIRQLVNSKIMLAISSLLADAGRDCTCVDPSTGFLSLTGAYMVPTGLSAEVFCFVIAL